MLDDLKYIHEKDAQDALGIAEKQSQQLEHEFEISPVLAVDEVNNIVVAGMGGSALAASILKSWPALSKPLEIVRGYDIPEYVDNSTLFIASSYSGNTEETLAALKQAEAKNAKIVIMASGGQLVDIAKVKNYSLVQLPGGLQPRYTTLYGLKAILTILDNAGVTEAKAIELTQAKDFLQKNITNWRPDVPAKNNLAKQLAQEIMGKSAVIYSGPKLSPAGYKWKININENAKNVAWANQYSELNHNEFNGWSFPQDKPYAVIELRSNLEHLRIQKRFEITERLLSGKRPAPLVVEPQGNNLLEQLLYSIALGDFVSLYLAILNGLNPTPVELIEKLKDALKD